MTIMGCKAQGRVFLNTSKGHSGPLEVKKDFTKPENNELLRSKKKVHVKAVKKDLTLPENNELFKTVGH